MKKVYDRRIYAVAGVIILIFAGLIYAWSVLSEPIAADFPEWTKAQMSMTFTIVMIVFCVGQLLCGIFAASVHPGTNVRIAAILFAAGFFLTAKTQSLPALYLGFGILGGLGSGLAYNAVMSTVTKWFPDRQGFISGVLLMGFGLGSFVIGKLYQAFTPAEPGAWRSSILLMGAVIFVVFLICSRFVSRPELRPADRPSQKDEDGLPDTKEIPPMMMLRKPSFWFFYIWAIALSASGLCMISQASGVAREIDQGLPAGAVATIVGLISVFNGIGRVLLGRMFDRSGRAKTMLLIEGFFLAATAVLIAAKLLDSTLLLIIGFALTGLGYGGAPLCGSAFASACFGQKYYSVNFPIINTNLILASFGSTIAGALYDATESYMSTFALMFALTLVGLLCCMGLSAQERKNA